MTLGKEETLSYVLDMERQLAKLAKKNGLPHLARLIDGLVEAAVPNLLHEVDINRAECPQKHSQKRS